MITIIGIYILSASLHYTGAAYWLGTQLYRFSGTSNTRLIIATMLAATFLSLFMNNVAVVGVLLPAIITPGRQSTGSHSTSYDSTGIRDHPGGNEYLAYHIQFNCQQQHLTRLGTNPTPYWIFSPLVFR